MVKNISPISPIGPIKNLLTGDLRNAFLFKKFTLLLLRFVII